ncbi:hypothetical protein [Neobacillus jeddahensis]|uniref:hypothetical protein n=1 Tax=Neobacillus jeddahensis TaxID=1461580 RepID=UPI0005A732CC|nr:hypothetical protein [Neobacillus jeddahensis]
MADYQIGDNLYADSQGKYYNLTNGKKTYQTSPYDTLASKYNQMYDAQRKSQSDQLNQSRTKAIAGYNQQKKELAPQYQQQRNQADVVKAQEASRLREIMAANGINGSGENLTTQARLASSRQDAFRDINNNEQTAYRDIDRQIANENDPSREQAIINAIEAERSSKLADAYAQSQQEIYQRYLDWRNYQLQLEQLKKASSGGGGGGGSSSSARKTTASSSAKTATNSFQAAKTSQAQTNIEKYRNNPIVQNMEAMKAKNAAMGRLFSQQVSVAENNNLSAWEKMKMLGL